MVGEPWKPTVTRDGEAPIEALSEKHQSQQTQVEGPSSSPAVQPDRQERGPAPAPTVLYPLPITDRQKLRCYVAYLFLTLLFVALTGRLLWIQCINHKKYVERAGKLHVEQLPIPAYRGLILDRNGRTLAITTEVNSVFADPIVVRNKNRTASVLAAVLGTDVREIREKLDRDKRFVWIERKVSDDRAEAIARQNLRGVGFIKEGKRSYPCGMLACHVLGFVDLDNVGREGIERLFDRCLSGTPGYREVERDGRHRQLGGPNLSYKPPTHGYSIVLTLDAVIQEIVEQELDTACLKWCPIGATAIVLSPATGEVLAMASRPAFDPNFFNKYPLDSLRNRAITDSFEPGSTFKPIVVSAAIAENAVDVETVFNCYRGQYKVGSRVIHDHHPYDKLSLPDVLIKSSNIAMAQIGIALGRDKLYDCVVRNGFGEKTGIELPGEASGLVWPREKWTSYSVTSVPMGQEISVTPLQLARTFAAYANGGMLLIPRLVRGVADNSGKRIQKLFPMQIKVRRACAPEIARGKIDPILIRVVEEGTGRRAMCRNYRVAGKTGTSQKLEPDGSYSHTKFVGSFVGYAPASDPVVCVLVMLDEPQGEYYGGTVAAPAVGKIIERVLGYMGVEPDPALLAKR